VKIVAYDEFTGELKALWETLELSSEHHVFQTFDWQKCWQETIGRQLLGNRPWIGVLLDAHGQPRIIFPFGVRRTYGVRVLEFLGGAQSDYLGPLIDRAWLPNTAQVRAAWELVSKQLPSHDVRHFSKLPSQWGHEKNPLLELWTIKFQANSYNASLPPTYDELRSRLRTKLKADTKRQRKRLAAFGTLEFEVLENGAGWIKGLDAMISQKRERYRNTGVPDMFSDPKIQKFYQDIPKVLSATGHIHLSVLRLNGEILATHWGAVFRDRFYFLMPTFAGGTWGAYSVGRLLLESLVEWCIRNNLKLFDFTIGAEDYKKDWCDGEMPLFEHLGAVTPIGLPYIAYILVRRRVRRNERCWNILRRMYSLAKYGRRAHN
jgi:CelD/BcsL family acetyltransferase involved in cellulose biosynthesis